MEAENSMERAIRQREAFGLWKQPVPSKTKGSRENEFPQFSVLSELMLVFPIIQTQKTEGKRDDDIHPRHCPEAQRREEKH